MTRITSESISRAYENFIMPQLAPGKTIDEIYICGGGAYNPNIMQHLQTRFPATKVATLHEAPTSMDPSAKEAILFALLGFLAVCGRTVPLATDAESREPAIMGVISPGKNFHDIMSRATQDASFQTAHELGRIIM